MKKKRLSNSSYQEQNEDGLVESIQLQNEKSFVNISSEDDSGERTQEIIAGLVRQQDNKDCELLTEQLSDQVHIGLYDSVESFEGLTMMKNRSVTESNSQKKVSKHRIACIDHNSKTIISPFSAHDIKAEATIDEPSKS